MATFTIYPEDGVAFAVDLPDLTAWALEQFISAGEQGVTPDPETALRWALRVHELCQADIDVETVGGTHGGRFIGRDARYVLKCRVGRAGPNSTNRTPSNPNCVSPAPFSSIGALAIAMLEKTAFAEAEAAA